MMVVHEEDSGILTTQSLILVFSKGISTSNKIVQQNVSWVDFFQKCLKCIPN